MAVTTLEQFNEEVMKEIEEKFVSLNQLFLSVGIEAKEKIVGNYSKFIKEFITQKLITQKELILRMVREKAPKWRSGIFQDKSWNDCKEEFLNNLDTI